MDDPAAILELLDKKETDNGKMEMVEQGKLASDALCTSHTRAPTPFCLKKSSLLCSSSTKSAGLLDDASSAFFAQSHGANSPQVKLHALQFCQCNLKQAKSYGLWRHTTYVYGSAASLASAARLSSPTMCS